jgi:hypothetical protein
MHAHCCRHVKRINIRHLLPCGGIIAHGVHACMSHGRRTGAGSAGGRVQGAGVGRERTALMWVGGRMQALGVGRGCEALIRMARSEWSG